MGLFTKSAARTNSKNTVYLRPANPGWIWHRRFHVFVEVSATTTTINRFTWQRTTGGTITTSAGDQFNTRTAAFGGTSGLNESVNATLSGNPFLIPWAGQEDKCQVPHFTFARPWAAPQTVDTDQGELYWVNAPGVGVAADMYLNGDVDPPKLNPRRYCRRPTRAGMWHTYRHVTDGNLRGTSPPAAMSANLSPTIWYAHSSRNIRWTTNGFAAQQSPAATVTPPRPVVLSQAVTTAAAW